MLPSCKSCVLVAVVVVLAVLVAYAAWVGGREAFAGKGTEGALIQGEASGRANDLEKALERRIQDRTTFDDSLDETRDDATQKDIVVGALQTVQCANGAEVRCSQGTKGCTDGSRVGPCRPKSDGHGDRDIVIANDPNSPLFEVLDSKDNSVGKLPKCFTDYDENEPTVIAEDGDDAFLCKDAGVCMDNRMVSVLQRLTGQTNVRKLVKRINRRCGNNQGVPVMHDTTDDGL